MSLVLAVLSSFACEKKRLAGCVPSSKGDAEVGIYDLMKRSQHYRLIL